MVEGTQVCVCVGKMLRSVCKVERVLIGSKELQSVDGRTGIHSTKAESDIFVVHASKHQKTRMDTFIEKGVYLSDDEPEEHDIYNPLPSEGSSSHIPSHGR